MKLIEKMAREVNAISTTKRHHLCEEEERLIDAYQAGFRKAREMAENDIRRSCLREPSDTAFFKIIHGCADGIKDLGEEEV